MVKGALPRQQLHGTVQVGARNRASEVGKESSTNKMATKRRHHLPHRYQYNLNPFIPFLFIRIVLWSNVMWSSVYDLGVHSCSLGIQDGKPGCRAPADAASDDGYSECSSVVHPCVSIVAQEILSYYYIILYYGLVQGRGCGGGRREKQTVFATNWIYAPLYMYHSSDITCDCDGAFCWFVLLILFLIYFSFFEGAQGASYHHCRF